MDLEKCPYLFRKTALECETNSGMSGKIKGKQTLWDNQSQIGSMSGVSNKKLVAAFEQTDVASCRSDRTDADCRNTAE